MVEPVEIFDVAATPLAEGITLVEASAGTGKTFAISMLVLRAVVERGIDLRQVLVVTYTVAATEELRGRIRARLIEARQWLQSGAGAPDQVLAGWLAGLADRDEALARLNLALLDIDSVGIHTIHGFCQRTLSEQVLECGHLFDSELTADLTLLRNDLIRDFWREHLYRLDDRYGALIVDRYPDPHTLYASIRGADNPLWVLLPDGPDLDDGCRELDGGLEELRRWWREQAPTLHRQLAEAAGAGLLKAEARDWEAWLEEIDATLEAGGAARPQTLSRLEPAYLEGALNRKKIKDPEARLALVESWALPGEASRRYLQAVERLLLATRLELARCLRGEMSGRLRRAGLTSFDELIADLAAAVDGPEGDGLARQVGARYRIALIDEFQDTDAAQCRIFFSLFGRGRHLLYLIGDPKQAIYRFRGADIHSYLEARTRVDRILTLDCNYRSNPKLVAALNGLLEGAEIGNTGYQPVRSPRQGGAERLRGPDGELPGLLYCHLDADGEHGEGAVAETEERVIDWVVDEVLRLINPDSPVLLEHEDPGGNVARAPVRPGSIGILVRANRQAERFFHVFSRRGVPAVLSSRQPVFQTRESEDLLLLLQAVARPADGALVRTVLARDWFGLSGADFISLGTDEEAFNRYRERFYEHHRRWKESGLLLMVNRLLEEEQVFLNLSRVPRAERRITNIQHLVELLQLQESDRRLTMSQILTWLQEKRRDPAVEQEAELRLESDGEAVNVITMHSAKGLEYQIVFCPFLYRSSVVAGRAAAVSCHDPGRGRLWDLGSASFDHHAGLAVQEELDEEMRLAYVALTRARLRCYLVWAVAKGGGAFEAPLGRLLFAGAPCDRDGQRLRLQALGAAAHCLYLPMIPAEEPAVYRPAGLDQGPLAARGYAEARLQTDRLRTSFTGLTRLSKPVHEETLKAGDEAQPGIVAEDEPLPGGVRFGNLVHEALERFDFAALGREAVDLAEIGALLGKHRFDLDPARIRELLRDTVSTPLIDRHREGERFSLATIPARTQIREMEFTLRLAPLSTGRIDEILAAEEAVSGLDRRALEGYLSGFVDLVFAHRGRYYIADYKTNNLGGREAYRREGLVAAMRTHNYGLQYWLYTLVVHRFLGNWLPGYRYRDHFGGVLYLFVRGMRPDRPGSGVYFHRPAEETLNRLDHLIAGDGHVRD